MLPEKYFFIDSEKLIEIKNKEKAESREDKENNKESFYWLAAHRRDRETKLGWSNNQKLETGAEADSHKKKE